MGIKKMPKNAEKYYCKECDFKCSKLSNYNQHLSTRKHRMLTNVDKMLTSPAEKNATRIFVCEICDKSYKHRQSLSFHKRNCIKIYENMKILVNKVESHNSENECDDKLDDITPSDFANVDSSDVVVKLLHKNNKLQETLIKQQNQITQLIDKAGPTNNTTNHNINNTTNNNNNINNTTNNFNLRLFLNEQCKDALNIMDFIQSLQIEFSEMEYTGQHGFVEGLSNILTKAIENLDITKRPIHCTDVKRETLYIKDNETWNKESDDKNKMKTAIDRLKENNMAKMSEWIKANPGCHSYDNPKNDLFVNMISAHANENEKDVKKVIKSVAKSSTIPKSIMKEQSEFLKKCKN